MNIQSNTSKLSRGIICSLQMLVAFSFVVLALTPTASQAKIRKTHALNPRSCATQVCNKSTGQLATLCTWKGTWDSVTTENKQGQTCAQVASDKTCGALHSMYDVTSNSCLCQNGYTHRDNGVWRSLGCERCPANTSWDAHTGSCTCNDSSQMFDTYDLVCRLGTLQAPDSCPAGLYWNVKAQICDHGCGPDPAFSAWDESKQSCTCMIKGMNWIPGPTELGFAGDCQCPDQNHFDFDSNSCTGGQAPVVPQGGCPRGQIKSRNGQCIPGVLRPTTNTNTNTQNKTQKRLVPPAGLLETTPGLSPQGPAAVGTPSRPR
jgi:hypothetical protein